MLSIKFIFNLVNHTCGSERETVAIVAFKTILQIIYDINIQLSETLYISVTLMFETGFCKYLIVKKLMSTQCVKMFFSFSAKLNLGTQGFRKTLTIYINTTLIITVIVCFPLYCDTPNLVLSKNDLKNIDP